MARLLSARTLVLGGLAVAAAARALSRRERGPAALGPGSDVPAPAPPPAQAPVGTPAASPGPAAPPAVANADLAGPPANTATHVPAPEPLVHEPAGGIDEQAEEAAAAAEAANIGGPAPEYPGTAAGDLADPETAPLIEAGEGESEGQELAEFELADNAEPSAGDPIEGGRQIDDVIEAQDDPFSGEVPADDQSAHGNPPAEAEQAAQAPGTPEPDTGGTLAAGTLAEGAPTAGGSLSGLAASPAETPAAEKSANVWRDPDAVAAAGDVPAAPSDVPTEDVPADGSLGEDATAGDSPPPAPSGDDPGEWKTWSGRAVEP